MHKVNSIKSVNLLHTLNPHTHATDRQLIDTGSPLKPHTYLEIEENVKYINLDSAELEEHQKTEVRQTFQQYHKTLSRKASQ